MIKENIVISITTIKSRIGNLPKILSSLMDKNKFEYTIHIFYSSNPNIYDEGCEKTDLENLREYIITNKNPNVQIKLSETENIGPYRKLIPALKIYKNHIIITIDDDEIFETSIVDRFVDLYMEYRCVVGSAGRIVDIGNWEKMTDTIDYYKRIYTTNKPYWNIIPEGFGGILYHSNMFDNDFVNFDYKSLDPITIKNDDIFIRTYTYNKNIPVFLTSISQSNIYNSDQINTLFGSNKSKKLFEIFSLSKNLQKDFNAKLYTNEHIDSITDISNLMNLYREQKNDITKRSVHTGTDVKKLQYKINYDQTDKFIDLNKTIQEKFFSTNAKTKTNVILINIEKDVIRYESSIREFKKFLIKDFVHLKATYWKEKDNFASDMFNVLKFLQNYNSKISVLGKNLNLNMFSEFDDPNIKIQDGPLACYCSHVRAMIYGYLNFSNYTIVVEDDLHTNQMELIVDNLQLIPDDWDIICFGAQPINRFYEGSFYKFTDLFHSTQFYIIKNSCMETIFANVYPIDDQIDILISKLHGILNIYNIPNSVLQKNYESNTQNNLYVIYNSPNYEYMRITIEKIKSLLHGVLEKKLKLSNILIYNKKYLSNIVLKILFDVVFTKITWIDEPDTDYYNNLQKENKKHTAKTDEYDEYFLQNDKEKLYTEIFIIINGCVKGINVDITVTNIINDIYNIIDGFEPKSEVENLIIPNQKLIPLNYGSTSNIFISVSQNENTNNINEENQIVIKSYNKDLRWKYLEKDLSHCVSSEIFQKEISILTKLNGLKHFVKMLKYTESDIYLQYAGESLFDTFILPLDWKEQMGAIFEQLDRNNIYYPEFNLKNITVKNGQIYLIDFGLCKIVDTNNLSTSNPNSVNLINFVELIDMIREKFETIVDLEQQHIYYNNLITNLKLNKNSKYRENIF
jgi:tRNA A-37 threonylcarbamoyl transferase component Bud32